MQPKRVIIGLFFIENEQGVIVKVNGDRYRAMLNKFLFTKIEGDDIGNIWFQQDGAPCHTAEVTLDVLALFLKIALSAAELMSWDKWEPNLLYYNKHNISDSSCLYCLFIFT